MAKAATLSFKGAGEAILLVGETQGWLGQSMYLWQVCGREEGAPPPVDLAAERRNGDFVRGLIAVGHVTAVHDLSDGGLAVGLAEMAMAGGVGATITATAPHQHGFLFGEDQARYLLTAHPQDVADIEAAARAGGVPMQMIGETGGQSLTLPGETPIVIADLVNAHEGWLPAYMAAAPK